MNSASLTKIVKGKLSKSPNSNRISTMPEYILPFSLTLSSLEETPIKPSSSPHSTRNSNIKSLHVPTLNLNGATTGRSSQNDSKFIKNLSISSLAPGSNTDRFKKSQIQESSSSRLNTDLSGKESPTDSTFFFYKNFDKFIQNLYLQDEKQIKKHTQSEISKSKDERMIATYKKNAKETITKATSRKASGSSNPKPSSPPARNYGEIKMRPLLGLDEKKLDMRYDEMKNKYKTSNVNSPTSVARSVQLNKSPRGISKERLIYNNVGESSTARNNPQSHFF